MEFTRNRIPKEPDAQKRPGRNLQEIQGHGSFEDTWKKPRRKIPTESERVNKEPDPSRTPGRPPDVIRFPKKADPQKKAGRNPQETKSQSKEPARKRRPNPHHSFLPRSQEIITVNRDHCPQLTTPRHTAKSNKQSRQSSHWGWVLTIIYSHASCVLLQDHHHHTRPFSRTPRPQ